MDEQSFLRDILLNPEDDAVRLAYADWLDQEGDPRAELLRLLVHAFQHETGKPSPTTVKLSRLIRDLEGIVSKDWLASVSRGYIEFCNMKGDVNCPGRWERLQSTPAPSVRRCGECKREVWFCLSKSDETKALRSRPSWHPILKAPAMKAVERG